MSILVLVAFFAVVAYYALKVMKKRDADFAAAAPKMGYAYSLAASPFEGSDMSGIALFTETSWRRFRNVLAAPGGRPVVISQFSYQIFRSKMKAEMGSVSTDKVQDHSLIAYRTPHGSLPRFRLYTRGMFGNLGMPLDAAAFKGKGGVDLGSAEFAQRYLLVAEDETRVRMLFTPFLVKALVDQPQHTWLHMQASPDWLVFYDPATRILKPEAIAPALARIGPIAERILGGSAAPDSPAPLDASAGSDPR